MQRNGGTVGSTYHLTARIVNDYWRKPVNNLEPVRIDQGRWFVRPLFIRIAVENLGPERVAASQGTHPLLRLVCDHCLSDEVEGTNRSRLYLACFSRDELVSSGWICFGDAAPMLPLHGVSDSLVFRLVDYREGDSESEEEEKNVTLEVVGQGGLLGFELLQLRK